MSDHATLTYDQEVGAKLRELRLRYVLKQEELAQALGVKHAAISRWECGARGLTVDTLLTIAERFGVPATELLPERHQAAPSPLLATNTRRRMLPLVVLFTSYRSDRILFCR